MKVLQSIAFVFVMMLLLTGNMPCLAQDSTGIDTVKSAPGIVIETSVDKAEIYIGDLINYSLTIIHDSDIIVTPPPIGANLGAFDVKDYQVGEEVRTENGRIKTQSKFLLTTFTTGDYIIPPIPVEFMTPDSVKKTLISEPIPIRVKSLLAETSDTADIRDIKGPIEFRSKFPWLYVLIGGIVVILGTLLTVRWWIKRRRKGEYEPIDTREPWEIASEKLAFLKEKNYPASGEIKQFYIELTSIIREFLQRVYVLPVLDMTTYEFLTAILQKDVEDELYNRLRGFLEFGDLVKFAKLIPEPVRIESDFEEGVNLVESIRSIQITMRTAAALGPEAEATEMKSV
jgi:hypothetical protein